MFTVTRAWIEANTNSNRITNDQAAVLGESVPLRAGWMQRAEGKVITDEARLRFEARIRQKDAKDIPAFDPNQGGLAF